MKTRTQFHLSQQQRDWLKQQTEKTGAPAAVVVRRLIDAAIEAEKTRASPEKGAAGKSK
jgi:predicted DNA-binding protein